LNLSVFAGIDLNSISFEGWNVILDIKHNLLIDIVHHKLIPAFLKQSIIEILHDIKILH
jgi:hypothetical protein